jgi:hypothetical protein
VARKTSSLTAAEAAHKSRDRMPHEKDHTMITWDVTQPRLMVVQHDTVAVGDGTERFRDRSSAGLAYMQKMDTHSFY